MRSATARRSTAAPATPYPAARTMLDDRFFPYLSSSSSSLSSSSSSLVPPTTATNTPGAPRLTPMLDLRRASVSSVSSVSDDEGGHDHAHRGHRLPWSQILATPSTAGAAMAADPGYGDDDFEDDEDNDDGNDRSGRASTGLGDPLPAMPSSWWLPVPIVRTPAPPPSPLPQTEHQNHHRHRHRHHDHVREPVAMDSPAMSASCAAAFFPTRSTASSSHHRRRHNSRPESVPNDNHGSLRLAIPGEQVPITLPIQSGKATERRRRPAHILASAVRELMATERRYLRDLRVLESAYATPMRDRVDVPADLVVLLLAEERVAAFSARLLDRLATAVLGGGWSEYATGTTGIPPSPSRQHRRRNRDSALGLGDLATESNAAVDAVLDQLDASGDAEAVAVVAQRVACVLIQSIPEMQTVYTSYCARSELGLDAAHRLEVLAPVILDSAAATTPTPFSPHLPSRTSLSSISSSSIPSSDPWPCSPSTNATPPPPSSRPCFPSLLIKPVQRVLKYPLFMRQMADAVESQINTANAASTGTDPSALASARAVLATANAALSRVAGAINAECARAADAARAVGPNTATATGPPQSDTRRHSHLRPSLPSMSGATRPASVATTVTSLGSRMSTVSATDSAVSQMYMSSSMGPSGELSATGSGPPSIPSPKSGSISLRLRSLRKRASRALANVRFE
ncbi:hypothetical protein BC828DRAFT_404006 [Blastocladiella britannica]|nr:hypothetical protein BC828DRAFT_404006 [Blastocladiella britannica]